MQDTVQSSFSLETDADGIAVLTFDTPRAAVNTFSRSRIEELKACVNSLQASSKLRGLILRSGKPGQFIAGADLQEILTAARANPQEGRALVDLGNQVLTTITRLDCPTVAAIDGPCVGGGLECVMAFDYRLASSSPRIELGAPEVKIGLIPGWGGTQRIPRLVGIDRAVELICGGNSISPAEAVDIGLVWSVVPPEALLDEARRVIELAHTLGGWRQQRELLAGPMGLSADNLAFNRAVVRAGVLQQTKDHYPAPLAAVEAIFDGCNLTLQEGIAKEREHFLKLLGTEVNQNLVRLFFMDQAVRKDPGVADTSIQPRKIRRAGVLGAGQMGAGIAFAHARRGFDVLLSDMNDEALRAGFERLRRPMEGRIKAGRMTPGEMIDALSRVHLSCERSDLARCDLVVEAVPEDRELKCRLLAEVEQTLASDALLASNTSTISITGLAQNLRRPQQFAGLHFFNPVDRMALVEVIRGKETSDAAVATLVAHAKALGKKPIVVQDCPGFLVNRCLFPYLNEAVLLAEEGVELERIDRAATAFGMPMGPITLMDLVGLDVTWMAGEVLRQAYEDRTVATALLEKLVKQGRLGQKSGSGFYAYDAKKPGRGKLDPVVRTMVAEIGRPARTAIDDAALEQRLFLPMAAECVRALEEQIVRKPEDIEFGMVHGIGFPAFRGGPLRWCDAVGAATIVDRLAGLEELGPRFAAPPLLRELARSRRKFFA